MLGITAHFPLLKECLDGIIEPLDVKLININ